MTTWRPPGLIEHGPAPEEPAPAGSSSPGRANFVRSFSGERTAGRIARKQIRGLSPRLRRRPGFVIAVTPLPFPGSRFVLRPGQGDENHGILNPEP